MRLNHNLYSLSIFKSYTRSVKNHGESLNRVGSGLKLSAAKDNADKIAQSESLRMTVIGRNAAASNIQDTSSMIQTFDGAMQEMNNNISRLKELVVRGNNGTYNDNDKEIIQTEIEQILNSMEELGNNTEFNGKKLSNPNGTNLSELDNLAAGIPTATKNYTSTIGTLAHETVNVISFNLSLNQLGLEDNTGKRINVINKEDAADALAKVDEAGKKISQVRSLYGSLQNRLDATETSMSEISDVMTKAQSSLADADVALEIIDVTKNKLLIDSAIGLMVQSNKLPQDALNILANVR